MFSFHSVGNFISTSVFKLCCILVHKLQKGKGIVGNPSHYIREFCFIASEPCCGSAVVKCAVTYLPDTISTYSKTPHSCRSYQKNYINVPAKQLYTSMKHHRYPDSMILVKDVHFISSSLELTLFS